MKTHLLLDDQTHFQKVKHKKRTKCKKTEDMTKLQKGTLIGIDAKPLPYRPITLYCILNTDLVQPVFTFIIEFIIVSIETSLIGGPLMLSTS